MRRRSLAILLSLSALLGACKAKESSTTKTIGVSLLTREHDFYRQLEAGMQDEAAKKGYRLIITTGD
ncbi:MAG TPA: hypothetical protein VHM30_12335, partial [Gemmatimonadaceae bacterium]|nr:hypothetical protein [Gemmatimonadaceae bacterium]